MAHRNSWFTDVKDRAFPWLCWFAWGYVWMCCKIWEIAQSPNVKGVDGVNSHTQMWTAKAITNTIFKILFTIICRSSQRREALHIDIRNGMRWRKSHHLSRSFSERETHQPSKKKSLWFAARLRPPRAGSRSIKNSSPRLGAELLVVQKGEGDGRGRSVEMIYSIADGTIWVNSGKYP